MNVERVFASLPEWSRELTEDQKTLLSRLMAAKNTKDFRDLDLKSIEVLGAQILKGDGAEAEVNELRRVIEALRPTRTDTDFI